MFRKLRGMLSRTLPPSALGMFDYVRPSAPNRWGGPLNGQRGRQAMIRDIVSALSPRAIVETGTFRGDTTAFFNEVSGSPIFSVEANERYYAYSRLRFWRAPRVHLRHADSRAFLTELASRPTFPRERVLFYLDAHWSEDLPLAEETLLVLHSWKEWVIVIDDFRVPRDPGFRFDDYGPGKCLELSLLPAEVLERSRVFWPSISSNDETGAQRGSVVLASLDGPANALARLNSLVTG